ncbi:MAG TPA: endolytic transglycosylase MltG [Vicinamibacterales bacterium]|nr:endolytic transglycosylase MltG [Vicinamibacterales bacterium]
MVKRLFFLFAFVLVAAGGLAAWTYHRATTPYRGFSDMERFVQIPSGTGVAGIAERLADAGVIPDPITFQVAARLTRADRHLQAGEYRFADAASPLDVLRRVARGDVYTRSVTFREGLTIAEMADVFAGSGLGTADDFVRAAGDGALVADLDPDARTLEGYLFPDTYALARDAGAVGTVHAMLDRFRRAFDAPLRAEAAADELSPRELVTLASLVEKETASPAERPIVAAVYRNRLKRGMPLQCDPTVIYALMQAGRWHGNITRADLQIDSPFNTYRHPGLPPGPIASPGRASLEAAAHPADVPYLYFVSRNDGTHAFATTLAEHSRNVARWQVRYFRSGKH